jgi:hypothetical protein
VDESAKDVASSDASRVGFGDRGRRFGDRRGTALIEGSVRPVPVVMTEGHQYLGQPCELGQCRSDLIGSDQSGNNTQVDRESSYRGGI